MLINCCGGYFFKFIENFNSICICIWLFGEDNKIKNFLKNFGLEFNCVYERIILMLDFELLYCNIFFGY